MFVIGGEFAQMGDFLVLFEEFTAVGGQQLLDLLLEFRRKGIRRVGFEFGLLYL